MLKVVRLGVILDFDGTIARIAPTPPEAAISLRVERTLPQLVSRISLVSVVSGRAVDDLRDKVAVDGVVYVGNHGAEYWDAGVLSVAEGVAEYRDSIERVMDHLRSVADAPGLVWDDKRYSASVHYRLAKDPAEARRALAAALGSAPDAGNLETFWGKMVLEIRSPAGMDKGYALRKLVRDRRLQGALVLGDDVTDVDALAALTELKSRGDLRGFGVAVLHPDSPQALRRSADYGLEGIEEVEDFLEWLAGAVPRE